MSRELFSRNPDLKRLRDEGFFSQIRGGLLIVREVPYVDAQRRVRRGTLVSSLTLSGDLTQKPDNHQVWWDGDFPCLADGSAMTGIGNGGGSYALGHGISARFHLSTKPDGGYADHYEKLSVYAGIISGPAATLEPNATPRVYRQPEDEGDGVFNYVDTASYRAGIGVLAERLANEVVAVVGLGGSGSYVLDLVAKCPVKEIRLFDRDEFLQHNAFRAPGAPSLDELREVPLKVEYFQRAYSKMHRRVVAYPEFLRAENLDLLTGVTFAFLCMDAGRDKQAVVGRLEALGVAFVDVGMGLELVDGALRGTLRATASTPVKRDHFPGRVSFAGGGPDDVYASNIQVADLNCLNATLAVIKWKKLRGFYWDFEREHNSTYTIDGNLLVSEDAA